MLTKTLCLMFCLYAAAGFGQTVHKWIDAEGKVHYGNIPPTGAARQPIGGNTSVIGNGGTRNTNTDAYMRAIQTLKQMREPPLSGAAPSVSVSTPSTGSQPLGYDARTRIENAEGRIKALSSSTIGSSLARRREIDAAREEINRIYAEHGIPMPASGTHLERASDAHKARAQEAENRSRSPVIYHGSDNVIFGSDGSVCHRSGEAMFCN